MVIADHLYELLDEVGEKPRRRQRVVKKWGQQREILKKQLEVSASEYLQNEEN